MSLGNTYQQRRKLFESVFEIFVKIRCNILKRIRIKVNGLLCHPGWPGTDLGLSTIPSIFSHQISKIVKQLRRWPFLLDTFGIFQRFTQFHEFVISITLTRPSRSVMERFGGVFGFSLPYFGFAVGLGAFVLGLSQHSSFL